MGSNDASRTVFDLRIISIAVVIALIVGAGTGYMFGNSPVSSLMEDRDQLEAECASLNLAVQGLAAELDSTQELLVEEQRDVTLLEERYMEMLVIDKENLALQQQVIDLEAEIAGLQNAYQYIEDEYEELHDEYMEIHDNYEILQASFESLNQSYSDLLSYLDATIIDSYSQSIEYNISAGTDRTWEFLIPEYGIIWEARISFNGWMVKKYHSWRRGDERYFVGGGSDSLITEGYDWIVYYGPRDYLWGTLKLEYYLDDRDQDRIWVIATMRSQLPTIGGIWDACIAIGTGQWVETEKSDVLKNGGLEGRQEEKNWLPPYWDGGGCMGGTDAGYIGRAEVLYSWTEGKTDPWCTQFWQDVQVNASMLELTFWFSANPRGESVTLVVTWGNLQILSQTWTGEETDWGNVSSTFPTEPGLHRLSFNILGVKDYSNDERPFVVIDEVTMVELTD